MKPADFAKRILALDPDTEIVDMYWCGEDVRHQADELGIELTDEQVADVISLLSSKHDANIGINWETISYWIHVINQ
jgi:hypothetical protein